MECLYGVLRASSKSRWLEDDDGHRKPWLNDAVPFGPVPEPGDRIAVLMIGGSAASYRLLTERETAGETTDKM